MVSIVLAIGGVLLDERFPNTLAAGEATSPLTPLFSRIFQ
jgi:hypothetical protein